MKFIHTFFNKKKYLEDTSSSTGILFLLFASILSVCLYGLVGIGLYLNALGFISPKDAYLLYSDKLVQYFPSNLVLSFKDGYMHKNISGVLSYPPSPEMSSIFLTGRHAQKEYFLQIDDTKTATVENYFDSKAVVFMGNDGIIGEKYNGVIQIVPTSKFGNRDIDQSKIKFIFLAMSAYVYKVLAFALLFIFVIAIFSIFISILTLNLLIALVVKFTRIIKKVISYKETLKFTNYAAVPALLISGALDMVVHIAFAYFIIIFATLFFVFQVKSKK